MSEEHKTVYTSKPSITTGCEICGKEDYGTPCDECMVSVKGACEKCLNIHEEGPCYTIDIVLDTCEVRADRWTICPVCRLNYFIPTDADNHGEGVCGPNLCKDCKSGRHSMHTWSLMYGQECINWTKDSPGESPCHCTHKVEELKCMRCGITEKRHLCDDVFAKRATKYHRRAQKAEGLVERYERVIEAHAGPSNGLGSAYWAMVEIYLEHKGVHPYKRYRDQQKALDEKRGRKRSDSGHILP